MLIPRPYQNETIARCQRQNLLDSDECGLGKTLIAIEAVKQLVAEHRKPALIIVKKRLRLQWLYALLEQDIASEHILELDAPLSSLEALTASLQQPVIVLTHYEAITKHCGSLWRFEFSVIVCDEAHAIKNRKAQRTSAVKQLRALRKIALTGTAFDRNPADVWSILNWLEPKFFSSYWKFFDAHVQYKVQAVSSHKAVNVKIPLGVKDHENFARVLRQFSVRRRKADVRADMPPKIEQIIDLDLLPAQRKLYDKIASANDIVVKLTDDISTLIPIKLTEILRLAQAALDPSLLGIDAPSVKLEWLADWFEDNEGTSVIVFTRFKSTAEHLHKLYGGKLIVGGSKPPVITTDDRLLFGTIAAMGEGLDLPHISTAIFLDVEWSSILMTQAVDRIDRINITESKHIIFLRAVDTVDSLLLDAVKNKWNQRELVEAFVRGYHEKEVSVAV